MKRLILMLFLLAFTPMLVVASEFSTSVPSSSQYNPKTNYVFNITTDIENVTSAKMEWLGVTSDASGAYPNYYFSITGLAAGSYSYKWHIMNDTQDYVFDQTYSVAKNSSLQISLTLDGSAADRGYKNNTGATFLASLPLPGKQIKLESAYPAFVTKTNTTPISYSLTLIGSGIFTSTASWSGDENYTESSITRSFDIGPPRISGEFAEPASPVGYVPTVSYKIWMSCSDISLSSVSFESNFSGSMKTYTVSTSPAVQNASGKFWVDLGVLGVRNFSYRWHAKDSLNDETIGPFSTYQILKMNPLIMELLPSVNLNEGTQVTATCYSINPNEINTSKFTFYQDFDEINNISQSTRMEAILMTAGYHNFTCKTNGTANYTNQSVTKTVFVSTGQPKPVVVEGEMMIQDMSFPSILSGQDADAIVTLRNNMNKNVLNLSVTINGVPSDWYYTENVSQIYANQTKSVKFSFSIPSDAEAKAYPIKVMVSGKASDGKSVYLEATTSLVIRSIITNSPPSFSGSFADSNLASSNSTLSIEWSDDKGISGFIFSSNATGYWVNESWIGVVGTDGWFNFTKELPSQANTTVAWKVYANDSNNMWAESDVYEVTTKENIALPSGLTIVVLIIVMVAVFALVAFVALRFKKKDEVEYVYSEDDKNEKP
jgi:hypothetical protein